MSMFIVAYLTRGSLCDRSDRNLIHSLITKMIFFDRISLFIAKNYIGIILVFIRYKELSNTRFLKTLLIFS